MKTISFVTRNFNKYDTASLVSYEAVGGFKALRKALAMDGYDIAAMIGECSVKGRGGAAYDMGKKWAQARDVEGESKVVICNADEGEPCTFKDRTLLQNDPFQVLEGMMIAGWTVGAQNGYLYMRQEYAHLRPLLLSAIAQCEKAGYLGDNILGSGWSYRIHLKSGAGAYVCGEGTALSESIEGKAGRPRMKPPFIKQCGLFKLPTCVNNVESLSLVPGILMDDAGFYKTQGTLDCPGTKLVSVAGNVKKPGVYEVPFGITLREIIYDLAGGVKEDRPIRLLQLGGASGKIASPDMLDTPYTYDDLKKNGLTVGSGAILVVDERTSILGFLRMTQSFFSYESCGQCTPCREGNRHIAIILDKMAESSHTGADIATLKKYASIMAGASLCGLGETAQSALLSAMDRFPDVFTIKEEVAVR